MVRSAGVIPPQLRDTLAALPAEPGVYLFYDAAGTLIYVGKATSLRARVGSYFQSSRRASRKTRHMVGEIARIEVITTATAVAALALESNLIKERRPRYNILMRDDKQYPFLQLTTTHPFPRLNVVRRVARDGNTYFGPFMTPGALRRTLRQLGRVAPLRQCTDHVFERADRPCLYHQIGRCGAPCAGLQSAAEYQRVVDRTRRILRGDTAALAKEIEAEMKAAARDLAFERAAHLRDQLEALGALQVRQEMISPQQDDLDVVAVERNDRGQWAAEVFFVRGGRVVGRSRRGLRVPDDEAERAGVLRAFVEQFYRQSSVVPPQIVVEELPEEWELLEAWLGEQRGGRVRLHRPQRGRKARLLDLVRRNLARHVEDRGGEEAGEAGRLWALREVLGLHAVPHRIECFDLSTLQGGESVGAVVAFVDGRPQRAAYRRYRIRTAPRRDDYAMLQEVLRRHYAPARLATTEPPDLILIDGGAGHLSAARAMLDELGLGALDVVALSKDRSQRRRGRIDLGEVVHLGQGRPPLPIAAGSPSAHPLRLLQAARDEAHRFAITYHRAARRDRVLRSRLLDIEGVGPRRAEALLTTLGSVSAVRAATVDELAAVPSMDRPTARRVYEFFRDDRAAP